MPDAIGMTGLGSAPSAMTSQSVAPPPPEDQFGKDTFMKLLVAQLKYQNPLSPTDSAQFMAQTAQFTMVEKLEEIAAMASESLMSNHALIATSTIGKEVTYVNADGEDATGTVTGVIFDARGPVLKVGDTEVAMAQVKEVHALPPADQQPDTDPGGDVGDDADPPDDVPA